MGYSFYAKSICFIVITRDQVNPNYQPQPLPDQSIADWLRSETNQSVIALVNEDDSVIDNVQYRCPYNSFRDNGKEKHDCAAIILSDMTVESYKGKTETNGDNFSIMKYVKFYADPEKDLQVINEVETSGD